MGYVVWLARVVRLIQLQKLRYKVMKPDSWDGDGDCLDQSTVIKLHFIVQ